MSDKNAKILLVEDDTSLSAVYRARLEVEGFEVKEVNNGEDALASAVEFRPNLIVLDAMMPKINGFDVLDILRNTPETANVRIIMLTALSQPKDKDRAKELGADDYLVKSQVVIGDVVERIKFHLNGGDHVQSSGSGDNVSSDNSDDLSDSSGDTDQDDTPETDNSADQLSDYESGEAHHDLDAAIASELASVEEAEETVADGDGAKNTDTSESESESGDDEYMLESALNDLENTEVDDKYFNSSETDKSSR